MIGLIKHHFGLVWCLGEGVVLLRYIFSHTKHTICNFFARFILFAQHMKNRNARQKCNTVSIKCVKRRCVTTVHIRNVSLNITCNE